MPAPYQYVCALPGGSYLIQGNEAQPSGSHMIHGQPFLLTFYWGPIHYVFGQPGQYTNRDIR
jgi:hypothetical protein